VKPGASQSNHKNQVVCCSYADPFQPVASTAKIKPGKMQLGKCSHSMLFFFFPHICECLVKIFSSKNWCGRNVSTAWKEQGYSSRGQRKLYRSSTDLDWFRGETDLGSTWLANNLPS